MPDTGATVNLRLLIQATNSASRQVLKLHDQINQLSRGTEQLGVKSARGARRATVGFDNMSTAIQRFTDSMERGRKATEGFGSAGLTLLGVAATLSTAAFFPVKSAADFEQAMSGVVAVTNNAEEAFNSLKETASELGRTTRFTAREAAIGMQFLGQAGFEAGEVMTGIGPAIQLAVAAAVDLGQAANIATNVLSGMRLPVSDLQEVVDVLAKTAAESNAELLDMAEALSYAGPIAASAGVNIQDLASVVGVLGNAGIQGSRAGTALRGTLFGLTAPTASASKRLEELGVHIRVGADGSIDLVDAFHQLADAGLQAADAQEIFGRFAATGVLAITSQIDALDDMVVANNAAAGSAQKMADIMKDNLRGSFVQMLSAVDGLKRAFGDPLLGPLRIAVKALTNMLGVVTGLVETFPVATKLLGVLVVSVAALAAAAGVAATAIGSLNLAMSLMAKPAIAKILVGIQTALFGVSTQAGTAAASFVAFRTTLAATSGVIAKVGVVMKALWVTMLANPILPIIAAVGALIYILSELEERQNRLISQARNAAVENENLRTSYLKQVDALRLMERGSEKAIATGKNMREQLLQTAEGNKELRIEATKAANSINEFTGEVTDGGTALDAFIAKTKELAEENIADQVSLINDQLDRQQNKLFDLLGIWNQIKLSTDLWISNMLPGGKKVEDVIKGNIEATRELKEEADLANQSYIRMLEKHGEFDPSMTTQEVVEWFRVFKGLSEERAKALAATNDAMRQEAETVRSITGTVGDLSLVNLREDINETIASVNDLGDAYDESVRKSEEAASVLSKIPDAARKNAIEEKAIFEKASKDRVDARAALLEGEKNTNLQILALRKKLRSETNSVYQNELEDLERQKELGLIVEWQYNNAVADLNKNRAVQEKENAIELQEALIGIREDTLAKLPTAQNIAKDLQKANEKILEEDQKASDARIKHSNTVRDALISSERQATSIRIDLMKEGPEKLRAQMEEELSILRDDSEKRGIHWEQLSGLRAAIEARTNQEIIRFREEESERLREEDEKRLKDEEKKAEERLKKERDLEAALREVRTTALDENDYEARNQLELDALDAKHASMLQKIVDFGASEAEIQETIDAQKLEKARLQADQQSAIEEMRKEAAIQAVDDIALATKEFFGKQSKEAKLAFAVQKGILIREAIMNTYDSAVKAFNALANIPYVGPALGGAAAAAAVAAGLAKVSMIRSQSLAGGGEVEGRSPHPKADNVPIWATAKEFIHPVSAVSYYGKDVMEAMRKKLIPREMFFGMPVARSAYVARGRRSYATGGEVSSSGISRATGNIPVPANEIKIMNFVDQREMLAAVGSPDGEDVVLNVISRNRDKISRVLN